MSETHVHGVLADMGPLVVGCPKCIFYSEAEIEHRSSEEVGYEALPCFGCKNFILATITVVGVSLEGHTWENEICELSWQAAVSVSNADWISMLRPDGVT